MQIFRDPWQHHMALKSIENLRTDFETSWNVMVITTPIANLNVFNVVNYLVPTSYRCTSGGSGISID